MEEEPREHLDHPLGQERCTDPRDPAAGVPGASARAPHASAREPGGAHRDRGYRIHPGEPRAHHEADRGGSWYIEQRFFARDTERIYGLGQRQHGYLDQKGCVLDLLHRNTEVSIPFLVSSEGYGCWPRSTR